ncbi:MAG: hypothetical protein Kilf2KO_26660 [Rhodospirillales bacterium]
MRQPLLRFLFRNCLLGIAAGWLILAGLLASDVGRLGSLIFASPHWPEAMVLLIVFFAITFGSLAMGTAVMLLQEAPSRSDGQGGFWQGVKARTGALLPEPPRQPARVPSRKR